MVNIKGEFHDVLRKYGKVIEDRGWWSNTIVKDYGKFLAALMKKEESMEGVGIEYMAVGGGETVEKVDEDRFKQYVKEYFGNKEKQDPYWVEESYWVSAKKILPENINYLPSNEESVKVGEITNILQIEVTFAKGVPAGENLEFKHFALLGINDSIEKSYETMFFINFVDHGVITKDTNTELIRTVKLTFPGGEKE